MTSLREMAETAARVYRDSKSVPGTPYGLLAFLGFRAGFEAGARAMGERTLETLGHHPDEECCERCGAIKAELAAMGEK